MTIYITFPGDYSVGIPSVEYSMQCPFSKNDYNKQEMDEFKEQVKQLYFDYSGGEHCYAEYDFERQYSDEFISVESQIAKQ